MIKRSPFSGIVRIVLISFSCVAILIAVVAINERFIRPNVTVIIDEYSDNEWSTDLEYNNIDEAIQYSAVSPITTYEYQGQKNNEQQLKISCANFKNEGQRVWMTIKTDSEFNLDGGQRKVLIKYISSNEDERNKFETLRFVHTPPSKQIHINVNLDNIKFLQSKENGYLGFVFSAVNSSAEDFDLTFLTPLEGAQDKIEEVLRKCQSN